MDDLLALFDEEEQNQQQQDDRSQRKHPIEGSERVTSSRNENRNEHGAASSNNRQQKQPSPKQSIDQQMSTFADNKVGIRMINRKISSSDLVDMISESEYQSPAALSAMSLVNLNQILVSPAQVLDPASVCGRTRILTVGLVFSNSGTRLSKAGNGFCALTVGNLASGPAISLLLFGSAFHQTAKIAKPGKVIAVMNPRLVPPQKQQQQQHSTVTTRSKCAARNDMAQTFSVSDEQQLRLVADARDFAFCKAAIASRNENGKWVPNAKRCTAHVDLRIGEFCHMHRKQALVKDNGSHIKGESTKGGLAQLRMEAQAFPNATAKLPLKDMTTHFPTTSLSSAGQLLAQGTSQERLRREISQLCSSSSRTTFGTNLRTFSASTTRQMPTSNAILNPYNNTKSADFNNKLKRPPARVTPITPRDFSVPTNKQSVSNDWLQEAISKKATTRSSRSATTTKPRHRAFPAHSTQFDGSVAIPQPLHKIFARNAGVTGGRRMPPNKVAVMGRQPLAGKPASATAAQDNVLWQQKQVAARLKQHQNTCAKRTLSTRKAVVQPSKNGATTTSSREELLFQSLGDIDRDTILQAKSRFSQEVDAQDYARARQNVTELEWEEEKRNASKNKSATVSAIQKEWHCANCQRSFSAKPDRCYSLSHTVKIRRSVGKSKSITEKRQELSDKDAKDGGLTLGQGLEWSRWNRL